MSFSFLTAIFFLIVAQADSPAFFCRVSWAGLGTSGDVMQGTAELSGRRGEEGLEALKVEVEVAYPGKTKVAPVIYDVIWRFDKGVRWTRGAGQKSFRERVLDQSPEDHVRLTLTRENASREPTWKELKLEETAEVLRMVTLIDPEAGQKDYLAVVRSPDTHGLAREVDYRLLRKDDRGFVRFIVYDTSFEPIPLSRFDLPPGYEAHREGD